MLFVSVPERNGVIVARACAKPPVQISRLGINHVSNGKSCLFQSNKINFFSLIMYATCCAFYI